MAALMSCTSPCVFCCISRNLVFGGRSITLFMDPGTMSRLMFGLIKATQPQCRMRERMRQRCVLCVVKSAPPSQFVARSIIVLNVSMPTILLDTACHSLMLNSADSSYAVLCFVGKVCDPLWSTWDLGGFSRGG